MQLDKTRIAVRERGTMELLDLTLHVVRVYLQPLTLTLLMGVVPMMVLNQLLLGWLLRGVEWGSTWSPEELGGVTRYLVNMSLLVVIEAPLATLFATAWLGQAVFLDQPGIRQVLREVAPLTPALAWCHLVVRGVLPAWLMVAAIEHSFEYSGWEVMLIFLTLYVLALRGFRPYINEIIALERLPLTRRANAPMTIGRRSSLLHGPAGPELFAQSMATALVGVLLVLGVYGVFLFLSGVLLNQWRPTPLLMQFCLPLSMWIVAGYLCVFRFLSYLNLRIRFEGWEVELRLRAEASRMMSKLV